jgi:hypothetical protein
MNSPHSVGRWIEISTRYILIVARDGKKNFKSARDLATKRPVVYYIYIFYY